MKSPSLLSFTFFLSVLFLSACKNEPPGGGPDSPAPADTAQKKPIAGDSATLQNLLKQYDPPDRVIWQKPEVVIEKMGDLTQKTVADIGAGSGFFSRRLAQHAQKVIAIELDERFVQFMDSLKRVELSPQYQSRLETRLATPSDSKLKPGETDFVLIVNTFIYIQDRVAYLRHLYEVLPQGGKILIVDFKKKRIPVKYPPTKVRLELFEVENELESAGFHNITSDDCALDFQYIVMAEK